MTPALMTATIHNHYVAATLTLEMAMTMPLTFSDNNRLRVC
jgi:hypothetical protein